MGEQPLPIPATVFLIFDLWDLTISLSSNSRGVDNAINVNPVAESN